MSPVAYILACLALAAASIAAPPAPPRSMDQRLTVELVAMEPDIRTPTAIAVDPRGRIWVLENNTHFRPKNYEAPPTDRIVIVEDFGADGRARKFTTFAEGFRNGMGMLLAKDGAVILSTRAETLRLRDKDGDGRADDRTTLLKLETKDEYPHNGLSAVALDDEGRLYVGFGENHGEPWTLTGTDGTVLRGTDEGAVFRCDPEGRKLEWWALGIWNPFGLAFDKDGRLFALDNDPSGGSLCRLLHIVRRGDYGYRYRYGRTVDHPFLSWLGQLPGTLPPVCLTGEAPTGVLQYRGASLPAKYREGLLGCTWSDHGVQHFPFESKGLSVTSKPQWLIRGGNDFRPSAIAATPDGSVVIGDWVDGSYEVHGKGRIWRVRSKDAGDSAPPHPSPRADLLAGLSERDKALLPILLDRSAETSRASPIEESTARELLRGAVVRPDAQHLTPPDPFVSHLAIEALAQTRDLKQLIASGDDPDSKVRVGVLLALRRSGAVEARERLPEWLKDPAGEVKRAALQWIAEEKITDLESKLELAIAGEPSRATFQAFLAALQFLTSGKPDPKATVEQTRRFALDPKRPADLRALALRLLPIEHPSLPTTTLRDLANGPEMEVRVEAVRILASRTDQAAQSELQRIAGDEQAAPAVRVEAVAGLTHSATAAGSNAALKAALASNQPELMREALRSLRGQRLQASDAQVLSRKAYAAGSTGNVEVVDLELHEQIQLAARAAGENIAEDAGKTGPPLSPQARYATIQQGKGDPAAGRRLFYHPKGPRCYTCHAIEGRGSTLGPDLTQTGRLTPEQLLEAIVEPSKEIGPAYVNWLIKLRDGREVSGIDQFEDNNSQITLIDAAGAKTKYKVDDIVSREELPVSLMPPALDQQMTTQELRDLLAYLREPRD